jgi:hypothetical protein
MDGGVTAAYWVRTIRGAGYGRGRQMGAVLFMAGLW